jgi:hypothetical protein
MEREFKIDITLAAEVAQFLEGLLVAEFNEELDAEAPVTDTFLDQFMPNGFVPNAELIEALLASGIITRIPEPESVICVGCSQTWCECE